MAEDESVSFLKPKEKPAPELTGAERLRAFEDKIFGPKIPRINGHVEKGIGSAHAKMPDPHRAHHDALVELVDAEKAHVEATAAEDKAHARLKAAIARAGATEPKD